jgi:hypothetical protein
MENAQSQGALDFSAPFLFAPTVVQVETKPAEKPKPQPEAIVLPGVKQVPPQMVEKDFATGDWIVWDTVEHVELFRGTREESVNFNATH